MTRIKLNSQLLISACLLGEPVRYDGLAKRLLDPRIDRWNQQGRLLAVCPETLGGLLTPRPPAEIVNGDGTAVLVGEAKVVTVDGDDVSEAFIGGAESVKSLLKERSIIAALLKRYSPSCGNDQIHDGSFSGQLIAGSGVTACLLVALGIPVFNEDQLDSLEALVEMSDCALAE